MKFKIIHENYNVSDLELWRIFVMIRKLLNGDIDRVADIWLETKRIKKLDYN